VTGDLSSSIVCLGSMSNAELPSEIPSCDSRGATSIEREGQVTANSQFTAAQL